MSDLSSSELAPFGVGDTSFQAAGGQAGIWQLVNDFYSIMAESASARRIRAMHPDDLAGSTDKLARFLCGWLGGPRLYNEKYGPIRLPMAHAHMAIDAADSQAWLSCMQQAIDKQSFSAEFSRYLITQLAVPADRIVTVCAHSQRAPRA